MVGDREEGFYLAAELLKELTQRRKPSMWGQANAGHPAQWETSLNRCWRADGSLILSCQISHGVHPQNCQGIHSPQQDTYDLFRGNSGGEWGQCILVLSYNESSCFYLVGIFDRILLPHRGLRLDWGVSLWDMRHMCVCLYVCMSVCFRVYTPMHIFSWSIIYML